MGEKFTRKNEVAFTKRALEALRPPKTGRTYYYDSKQENLALCVSAAGSKTFYRTGRVNGRAQRLKLGKFPDMSVEQARKAAHVVAGDMARGLDPSQQKQAGDTIQSLWDHWLAHAKRHKKTWADDERQYNTYFKPLKNKRLTEIKTAHIAKWHATIGDKHGQYQANRCRALLSAMYNEAHRLGYEGINPCQHVKRFPEESRERFLLVEEMEPFFDTLKAEEPVWRDFWLLCLFTGARRGNVAAMAWQNIDLEQGVWRLSGSQTKNKKAVVVVLVPPAVEILRARAENRNGSDFVFTSKSRTGHINDPRKSWARVMKRAGLDDLRPHDLRRSLGSWQALAGTSLPIIGASLGHKDVKSTAIYARLQVDPIRESVDTAVAAMMQAGKAKDEG